MDGYQLSLSEAPALDNYTLSFAYRYWRIDSKGWLASPAYDSAIWIPGLNQARCGHRPPIVDCKQGCGLYAISPSDPDSRETYGYFDLATGDTREENTVVGCIAMWDMRKVYGSVVAAPYAAPAAFCLPESVSRKRRRQLRSVARRYQAPLVPRADLLFRAEAFIEDNARELCPGAMTTAAPSCKKQVAVTV